MMAKNKKLCRNRKVKIKKKVDGAFGGQGYKISKMGQA